MIPRSQTFAKGYAISHEEVVRFVMAIIPQEKVPDGAKIGRAHV